MSIVSNVQAKRRIPFLQIVKTLVATVSAWFLALLFYPDQIPIFAAVAAIIVVQPSVNQSLGKAIERSTGVILGVGLALLASLLLGNHGWLVLLTIVIAMIVGWALKFTPGTTNQIAISAMLVIAIGAATPEYALGRVVETIIGAGVAVLVNAIIVPPVALTPATDAIAVLGANIAEILEDIGSVLRRPTSHEVLTNIHSRARELRQQLNSAQSTLKSAEESLRFNLVKKNSQQAIDQRQQLLNQLAVLVTRTIGVARAVIDNYDDSVIREPVIAEISEEFIRAGHDLRLLVRDAGLPAVGQEHPATQEMPALTKPISVKAPSGGNWILVGFLMENLRRIREEIIGTNDE